jgi:hypothetical protein
MENMMNNNQELANFLEEMRREKTHLHGKKADNLWKKFFPSELRSGSGIYVPGTIVSARHIKTENENYTVEYAYIFDDGEYITSTEDSSLNAHGFYRQIEIIGRHIELGWMDMPPLDLESASYEELTVALSYFEQPQKRLLVAEKGGNTYVICPPSFEGGSYYRGEKNELPATHSFPAFSSLRQPSWSRRNIFLVPDQKEMKYGEG